MLLQPPLLVRLAAACMILAAALSPPAPVRAEPPGGSASNGSATAATTDAAAKGSGPSVDDICRTLAQAAAGNDLPEEFFTRLIWQESRFDPAAVSPAGAQGIAQFMPQTAAMRRLTNAFEPLQALRESASYLRELRTTFRGNLGLAAAAYNAGPGPVEAWLARRSVLPAETQAYVMIVTGYAAEAWASKSPPQLEASAAPPSTPEMGARCAEIAKSMIERTRRRPDLTASPAWGPWGVLGDRLPLVLNGRRRAGVPFLVRVSEESRQAANALCAKLMAAGGNCIVLRNPRN
jgi:hypothetical protein